MKICFWGSDRRGSIAALKFMLKWKEEIDCVVVSKNELNGEMVSFCKSENIDYCTQDDIEQSLGYKWDVGISYLYPNRIKKNCIDMHKDGIINFHPAPLPDHKGVSGLCHAIINGLDEWGVSCHYVDEDFDTGGIIEVERFQIDSNLITGIELSNIVQSKLYELFCETIQKYRVNGKLKSYMQDIHKGEYHSKKDLEKLKLVDGNESADELRRKVHGLFYPPFRGANICINGDYYTLIDDSILDKIANLVNEFEA